MFKGTIIAQIIGSCWGCNFSENIRFWSICTFRCIH